MDGCDGRSRRASFGSCRAVGSAVSCPPSRWVSTCFVREGGGGGQREKRWWVCRSAAEDSVRRVLCLFRAGFLRFSSCITVAKYWCRGGGAAVSSKGRTALGPVHASHNSSNSGASRALLYSFVFIPYSCNRPSILLPSRHLLSPTELTTVKHLGPKQMPLPMNRLWCGGRAVNLFFFSRVMAERAGRNRAFLPVVDTASFGRGRKPTKKRAP